jgi:hypothetical protein
MATSKILRLSEMGAEAWESATTLGYGNPLNGTDWGVMEDIPNAVSSFAVVNTNVFVYIRLNAEYTIEKFGFAGTNFNFLVEYSTNVDADYLNIVDWADLSPTSIGPWAPYAVQDVTVQTGVRWLRMSGDGSSQTMRQLHFYGKKETVTYDLFENVGLTNPIGTTSDWLTMTVGATGVDYVGTADFWLKNTDAGAHTYDIQIGVMDRTGDVMISGNTTGDDWMNIKINDGTATDAYTAAVPTGSVGAAGNVKITVSANVPTASVTTGDHYYFIKVTQTS